MAEEDEVTKLREQLDQLRKVLLACSRKRQFGPCWCQTEAGWYCVGQARCKAARKALDLNGD
jgi:hypothetical protein